MSESLKIWDPLVRIGHWIVVLGFAIAYLVGDEALGLHVWAGYIVGIVVIFRIVWGFVGPQKARFSDFVYRPRAVIAYLSGLIHFRAKRYLGHSPAGGAMVVVLLSMLAGTVITGMMTYGADKKAGPLAPLYATGTTSGVQASKDSGESEGQESAIAELHDVFANLTLILVGLHVVGVALASIVHRENLVAAMVTGRKRPGEDGRPAP
jgi:cytochrome b